VTITHDFHELARRYLTAQLEGDSREAARIVIEDAIHKGARVVDVMAFVIRAAQLELGNLWQANRISIAEEHMATGISQIMMARLLEYETPAERNGKLVTVACVEGELHDFPARMVADYLDLAGFAVHYFGANMPCDQLVPVLRRQPTDLLALSATMTFHVPALRTMVSRVRVELGTELPIMVGGHVFDWSEGLAADLGVTVAPADPSSIVSLAKSLTGLT